MDKGIGGIGDILNSERKYGTCEEIPKIKEDQMTRPLKLKYKYELNLKNLTECKNLK